MTNLQVILYWIITIYSDTRVMEQDTDSGLDLPSVFIVGTHSGSLLLGKHENERKLKVKEKFDKIKRALAGTPYESHVFPRYFCVENSSPNDENIAELKKELEKLMKKMNKTIPLSWVHFQSEIQKLSEEKVICPLEEVKSIAANCGILDDKAQLALLDYLYDLGEIVFIRTIEALQNVVVVNPLSLVGYSKAVFTVVIPELQLAIMKQSWRRLDKGILEERLLRFLWKDIKDLDRNFDILVKFMERFGLLCERKSSKDCSERVFYTPLRLKPIAEQQRLTEDYGIRAISIFHDFCGYLPEELFPQTVTRFIEKFQVEAGGEPELAHEYADLYLDDNHHVIFSVVTFKRRRMFKTTIVRRMILNETISLIEPGPESCKKVLRFLETAFELHNVNDRRGIHVKLCILCPCSQKTEHMQILRDFKQDLLPCGRDSVRITRYQRLFGDGNKSEKVCLDDKTLLSICDELKSDWKLVGVQLGLQLSEIDCIEKDNKLEKNAIMAMLVSWRNKQPSNINQLITVSSALAQRGYYQLSEQLTGKLNPEEVYSVCLDDKTLLTICNEIKSDWKLVGVQLGLQLSEIDCIEKDNKLEKNAIMAMLESWRNKQPSNVNQLTAMSSALTQRGYNWLSDQLTGNLNLTEGFSEHQPSACALCSLCCDDEHQLPNKSNIPNEYAVDETEFRSLLLEISKHIDEEDLQVLKVTLTDHIKDAQKLINADRATQLFEFLIKQDILSPNDMRILFEVLKLTQLNHLQRFIKGCPPVEDIQIIFFSKFRQSVVVFGRALTNSLAREIEYKCFGRESLYKKKWDLIMKLERNLILCNDESIENFKAKFKRHVSK
ncbi:uncharacterized protein LOC117117730 [Anneissia japonica]|uniref:uncharacterized protein LOC117117730 n=1 Tax=Anneissia japonica TaxID=1529436 RepID=UPI00142556F9|nr:uncharacterized protein LOC117117730 [Anneissia japonica]